MTEPKEQEVTEKKLFEVRVPVVGWAYAEVEAEDEESAIQTALEGVTVTNLEEWEAVAYAVRGNVFYGPLAQAEATEIDR